MALQKVGAAMTRGVIKTAATLTALKAAVPLEDGAAFQTLARTAEGDGGGESWIYDADATDTPNDVTVSRPDSISGSNPGRYKVNLVKSYQKLIPAGNAAADTAIMQAAMAAGGIYELKPYSVWDINAPCPPVSNTRLIGNGATIRAVLGSGGFNSQSRNQKFNNGANTCIFVVGAAGGTVERENVSFHDIVWTASDATERLLQLVQFLEGADTSQFRCTDMLVKDINCHAGGGFFGAHSLGEGSALFDNIHAIGCNVSSNTGWTGNIQMTLVEVDSDLTDGPSKPGTIRNVSARDFQLTGAAYTANGAQSDVVTLAGVVLTAKCGAWSVENIFGKQVGEVVDCFANGARLIGIRGEQFNYAVVTLKHGARFCTITGVSGAECLGDGVAAGSLISFAGTDSAGSGDTMENVVNSFSCDAGWDTASSPAILFAKNGGSVGIPKRNLVYGGRVVGDGNMSQIVRDNVDSDQNAGNRVVMVDGTAWASGFASVAYPDNTRVSGFQPTMVRIGLGAASQTVATATNVTVDFSTVVEDLEGIAVTASDKVRVTRPGRFFVAAAVRWTDLGADEEVTVRVMQATSVVATNVYTQSASGDNPVVTAIGIVDIDESDLGTTSADISCQVRQETGANRTIGQAASLTQLVITRID